MVDHKMQKTNRKDAVVVPVNEEVVSRSLEIKLAGGAEGTSMDAVRKAIKRRYMELIQRVNQKNVILM